VRNALALRQDIRVGVALQGSQMAAPVAVFIAAETSMVPWVCA